MTTRTTLVDLQFPEVRTTELFVEIADSLASSGGSAPIPRPVNVGEASGSRNQRVVSPVASPSFDFNLQAEMATCANELGDFRSFGELGVAVAATPQPVSPPAFEGVPVPDPQVVEAWRANDSDAEPEFIEGESDDEAGPVPPPQGGREASGASGATSSAQASQGSNMPAEFVVG
ncbi:hypothetical protein PIB30_063595 [Stylosanthes scabra]|uniref:Uncharacterized protein n=1 Tax=Stylosanthes scabra TaxID=79078 RepID=A0ABU6SLX8_9FABA|nr:hypothetical protein [Stylosanthes scabra]